jgi:hypothetical protein
MLVPVLPHAHVQAGARTSKQGPDLWGHVSSTQATVPVAASRNSTTRVPRMSTPCGLPAGTFSLRAAQVGQQQARKPC